MATVTKIWCILSQLLNVLIYTFDQWGLHYNGLQNYEGLKLNFSETVNKFHVMSVNGFGAS